jgi:hypothetical protein
VGSCPERILGGQHPSNAKLENVPLPGFLDAQKALRLSHPGQKPQIPEVHAPVAHNATEGWVNVSFVNEARPTGLVVEF